MPANRSENSRRFMRMDSTMARARRASSSRGARNASARGSRSVCTPHRHRSAPCTPNARLLGAVQKFGQRACPFCHLQHMRRAIHVWQGTSIDLEGLPMAIGPRSLSDVTLYLLTSIWATSSARIVVEGYAPNEVIVLHFLAFIALVCIYIFRWRRNRHRNTNAATESSTQSAPTLRRSESSMRETIQRHFPR
jgi:hypothetical protein